MHLLTAGARPHAAQQLGATVEAHQLGQALAGGADRQGQQLAAVRLIVDEQRVGATGVGREVDVADEARGVDAGPQVGEGRVDIASLCAAFTSAAAMFCRTSGIRPASTRG